MGMSIDEHLLYEMGYNTGFKDGIKGSIPKDQYEARLKAEKNALLDKLMRKMKERDEDNGGEPLNAIDQGYHLAFEHLCEEINALKENKCNE